MNKINFVGGDKLLPVFKHGFLRSEENFLQTSGSHVLKTGENLSPPTKLILFMRKSLTTKLTCFQFIFHLLRLIAKLFQLSVYSQDHRRHLWPSKLKILKFMKNFRMT